MATHYRCDPLSDQQVIEQAQTLRRHHGLGDNEAPDVISVVRRDTVSTRFGTKTFRYRVVEASELGDDEARTNIEGELVEVIVSKATDFRARVGDGRARMTIAHELAHAVLHRNAIPLARARNDDGKTFLKPFEDVEHQAKVFASHYLMPESAVVASEDPSDLAGRFYVSLEAAQIRCKIAKERANRANVQAMLRALGDELRVASLTARSSIGATSVCTSCGQPTLRDSGAKSYCSTCARMSDAYADGDGLD